MKVLNKKTVTTATTIEVTQEDLINALNASGDYNIPYNARVWIHCEKRQNYDLKEGIINISFNISEDVPEFINTPIPF